MKENLMLLSIWIVLLCLSMTGLVGWRIRKEYVVRKVNLDLTLTPLMKRKLFFFRQKMRNDHLFIILGVSGLTAVVLILLTLSQLMSEKKVNELIHNHYQLKEELTITKNEINELIKTPLFVYPSNQRIFESIDWERLLVSSDYEKRYEIEQELSYQLSPFLGRTLVYVSIDQSMQEISLAFMSKVESLSDLPHWEENLEHLVEDLHEPLITQSSFTVLLTDEPDDSFEQIIMRNDAGEWELLARRLLSNEEESVKEAAQETFELEDFETKQTIEKDENSEQKGSVTFYEQK